MEPSAAIFYEFWEEFSFMAAVGNMPDVPRNVMPLCSCHLVRLSKTALFAPKLGLLSTTF
jgi:hypothetical protein